MANVEVTEVLEELIAFATSYKTMIPLCNLNDNMSVEEKQELSEYESGDDDYSIVNEGKFPSSI
jgi:hypothetical protein